MDMKLSYWWNELKIYGMTFRSVVKDTCSIKTGKAYLAQLTDRILQDKERLLAEHPELAETLTCIEERGQASVFNAAFETHYRSNGPQVLFDEEMDLKYVFHNGKKLYYPALRSSLIRVMYQGIAVEQDAASPHRYLDPGEDLAGAVVFDCGSAEANFTLDIIEKVKKAYLFEGDTQWHRALAATFAPWKDKVHVVKRFLGDRTQAGMISLRGYIEGLAAQGAIDLERDSILIKMDIEGWETTVLQDLLPLLDRCRHLKLAVCVYHRADDEAQIRAMLPDDYHAEVRPGHMLFIFERELPGGHEPEYPYFRHGVMRIERADA